MRASLPSYGPAKGDGVDDERAQDGGPGEEAEQEELDRQREDDDKDQAEGQAESSRGDEPGHKVKQAEPEEKAEEETTEDIDRAFD
jgi:hypothetical protein